MTDNSSSAVEKPKARKTRTRRDRNPDAPTVIGDRQWRPSGMRRQARVTRVDGARLIAFDFETTAIRPGTPAPLYLTAYSESPEFAFEGRIHGMEHLRDLLIARFLRPELSGSKFVAWNANNFDSYFVAAALCLSDDYVMRPYLTRGNTLRGLRVIVKGDQDKNPRDQVSWEFLDGIAMLGLAGFTLEKFLATFAPDYAKLTGVIDFQSGEEFDPENAEHRAYAMRDSVGLWHAMHRAQSILIDNFNASLAVTMGAACIKIFRAHIPDGVVIHNLPDDCLRTVRDYVMRGGFCYCVRMFHGPIWKYDINQAYAAAMRETKLPAGRALHTQAGLHRYAQIYIARLTASNPRNKIPFFYRTFRNGMIRAEFGTTELSETWLTSIEVEQLRAEGWRIDIRESWTFEDHFTMRDYVDRLERVRTTCEGGPSGPIGTIIKAVGNHSYGKTVEQLENEEHLIARECPDGYAPYYRSTDDDEPIEHVWYRFTNPRAKDYHQPHVGAFITAHVRMVIRRAALVAPDAWLYADTDCVVFSEDVTDRLDIDPKRYGAFKIEETGTVYKIIAKKVYQDVKSGKGHAKGLNVKRLSASDFSDWFDGSPPVQDQVQRNNFIAVMNGAEMFRDQRRTGTSVDTRSKTVV